MGVTVAIDGPAGSGKSVVARHLARYLQYTYIDTGAMYRTVALLSLQAGVSAEDATEVIALAHALYIQFSSLTDDGVQSVFANGIEVTHAIRTPEVSQRTSQIAVIPEVRKIMVAHQRRIGTESERGVVLEGRDIGSVVFPHAELKVFLTASAEERARRRWRELIQKGVDCDYDTVLRDQQERDARDSQREVSPLCAAADAVQLSTDGMTISEVVLKVLALGAERRLWEKPQEGIAL